MNRDVVRGLAEQVDTTAICDAQKSTRVLDCLIRCRSANPNLFGFAYTVRCRSDFFGVLRAIENASPGDVVVVDGGGVELALAGELFAREAQLRGLAGIVVDGGYRDISYVSGCQLPIFSRHVTPMAGSTSKLGELQVPISCGGVSVEPGEIVVGDAGGLLVLSTTEAVPVLRAAVEVKDLEAKVVRRLEEGGNLSDCLNVAEHSSALQRGDLSALGFTV